MVIIKWLNRIIFITVYYVPFSIEKGHIATHVFSFFSLSLIVFFFSFFFFFLSCKRSFFCDISRTACRRLLKFFLSRFRSIRHLLNEKFFFPQLWGLPNPKNRRNRSSRMIQRTADQFVVKFGQYYLQDVALHGFEQNSRFFEKWGSRGGSKTPNF